jgi:hypothetical protein
MRPLGLLPTASTVAVAASRSRVAAGNTGVPCPTGRGGQPESGIHGVGLRRWRREEDRQPTCPTKFMVVTVGVGVLVDVSVVEVIRVRAEERRQTAVKFGSGMGDELGEGDCSSACGLVGSFRGRSRGSLMSAFHCPSRAHTTHFRAFPWSGERLWSAVGMLKPSARIS